jgi:serine protease
VLGTDGSGNTSSVIAAVQWCVEQKANILSLSLGSSEYVERESMAFAAAADAGVLSIAATGNDGKDVRMGFPAGYAAVMAVGALETDGGVADFSQHFPAPDSTNGPKAGSVMAPGTVVQSTMIVGQGTAYTEEFTVGGQAFRGDGLEFSPIGGYSGALVDCGLGDTATSCGAGATCDGFVAYVERGGGIPFGDKARNAILQGAKAVVVGNNNPEDDAALGFTLGDASADWVPTVAVSTTDAAAIKARVGSQVTLSLAGSDYAVQQGTSMATPHVTGVAALVWSARPTLKNTEVRSLLQRSAKDLGADGYDSVYGYGLVQAKDALELLAAP